MKPVFQTDEFGCGIACVAMLCGISYSQAKRICDPVFDPKDGIEFEPMMAVLSQQGFVVEREGRISQKRPVTFLKHNALLWCEQLPTKGTIKRFDNVFNHWALWDADDQVVRDPYRYKKPIWLTHFYELRR